MSEENISNEDTASQRRPHFSVSSIEFSNGSNLKFNDNDIVVFVGPNNAGKSAALNGIKEKSQLMATPNPVLQNIEFVKRGSVNDVIAWLEKIFRKHRNNLEPDNPTYSGFGRNVSHTYLARWAQDDLYDLAQIFICHLTAQERLGAANSPAQIKRTSDPLTHPIHYLQADERLELKFSGYFRKAFNEDLIVHRLAGAFVPLYSGQRPKLQPDERPWDLSYLRRIEELPELQTQGDGMRAFAGVLLHAIIVEHSILLIDEPEAFLHPPQAKLLGKLIATEVPDDRQIFIATHSIDFLKGLLEADTKRLRILRIQRDGQVNKISELNNEEIKSVWSDSLLRYSNVLDGVFHRRAVICEGDSDSRFYSAIADCFFKNDQYDTDSDLMFINCGGKDRFPTVINALKKLDVPLISILDLDVLNDEQPLKAIVEGHEGDWKEIEPDFRRVKSSVEEKKPELITQDVTKEINKILQDVTGQFFPKDACKKINKILKRSSPWEIVKDTGASYIPHGEVRQAYSRLRDALKLLGIYIVEVGTVEGFAPSVGNHGPKWVNGVLTRSLCDDPELADARTFVQEILGLKNSRQPGSMEAN